MATKGSFMGSVSASKQRFLDRASRYNEEVNTILYWIGNHMPQYTHMAHSLVTHHDLRTDDLYVNAKAKIASLLLLTEPDVEAAIQRFAGMMNIRWHGAETGLVSFLNDGPEDWLKDEGFFEERGLIRGVARYYMMPQTLESGLELQTLKQGIAPELRRIFVACVDCAHTNQAGYGVRIPPSTLTYVAAQLWPEGEEKQALFERLAQLIPQASYLVGIEKSAKAIQTLSEHFAIDISDISIRETERQKEGRDKVSANSKSTKQGVSLTQELDLLVARGAISVAERKAFLWLTSKEEAGEKPSLIALQSLLMTRNVRVSFSDAVCFKDRMADELKVLRADVDNNSIRLGMR